MGERDWAPPDWPVGLPLPDLSRPPPWLLPPPPLGTPPPGCPPGGWAQSWDTAVPWPPSQPPSEWSAEEEEEEEEWEEEAGAVVWRVGDPVQADGDEEEEEEDETVLELNEEWVARFAVTAHRRAARARPLRFFFAPLPALTLTCFLSGKQFERESLAGGGQRHAAPPAVPSGGRIESRGGASVSAPQTVLELVQAARAGTTRPNEGACAA